MCRSDGHIRDLCLVHADRKAAGGGRSIFTGGTVGGMVRWALNLYCGDSWWNGSVGGQYLLGGGQLVEWGGQSIFTGGTVGGMVRWAVNIYWGGTVGGMGWALNLYWGNIWGNGSVGAQSLLGGQLVEWFGGRSIFTGGGWSVERFGGRSIFTGGGAVGGMVWWAVNLYWGDGRWNGSVGGQSLVGGGQLVEWFGWAVNLYWGDGRWNGSVGVLNVFICLWAIWRNEWVV